jgi:hypothetical protein
MAEIQGRKSCELKQPETYVSTIVVRDDGLVDMEGHNLKLTLWNHSPGLLRSALRYYGRRVVWKPRFHVLTVRGRSSRHFNMATVDDRTPCKKAALPGPDETFEEFVLRAMREDGGYSLPTSSPLLKDALKDGRNSI